MMIRRKKNNKKDDIEQLDDELELESSLDNENDFNDDDEEFKFDDDIDDFDDLFDDDEKNDKASPLTKEKAKEFYVKKDDLIREIRKYNDSKSTTPDGRGIISEELRTDDYEDLYKIFNAPSILWLQL